MFTCPDFVYNVLVYMSVAVVCVCKSYFACSWGCMAIDKVYSCMFCEIHNVEIRTISAIPKISFAIIIGFDRIALVSLYIYLLSKENIHKWLKHIAIRRIHSPNQEH